MISIPFATDALRDAVTDPTILPRYAVHIGVHKPDLSNLDQTFAFEVAGDGWFSWGDPVGTAGNDDSTYHVMFATNAPAQITGMLLSHLYPFLVPMDDGTIIQTSDFKEWPQQADSMHIVVSVPL